MTSLEIGVPLLFAVVLISIRSIITPEPVKHPTQWNPFSISRLSHNFNESHIVREPWHLFYCPINNNTHDLMYIVSGVFYGKDIDKVVGYDNETDMLQAIMDCLEASSEFSPCPVLGGVVLESLFPMNLSVSTDVRYKIRLAASGRFNKSQDASQYSAEVLSSWHTDRMFPAFQLPGPRSHSSYGGSPSTTYHI